MKKLTVLLFASSLFIFSCEKINDANNRESGFVNSYYTIKTGDSYKICYQKLQDLYKTDQIINYMYVPNAGFHSIDNYNSMISLYSEFRIIDKGTKNYGDTIVFSFHKDTLQSIYNLNDISPLTGGPTDLTEWPDNSVSLNTIKRGDTKEEIFDKLTALKTEGELGNRLNSVIYTVKDLNTSYDSNTANAVLWSIIESYDMTKQKQYFFNIHFADGIVSGIEIKEVHILAYN